MHKQPHFNSSISASAILATPKKVKLGHIMGATNEILRIIGNIATNQMIKNETARQEQIRHLGHVIYLLENYSASMAWTYLHKAGKSDPNFRAVRSTVFRILGKAMSMQHPKIGAITELAYHKQGTWLLICGTKAVADFAEAALARHRGGLAHLSVVGKPKKGVKWDYAIAYCHEQKGLAEAHAEKGAYVLELDKQIDILR